MTFTTINVGQSANDTTGDALRTAFIKLNNAVGSLDSQAYFNARLVQSNVFLNNTFTYFNANLTGNVYTTGNLTANVLTVTTFSPLSLAVGATLSGNVGNVYAGNIHVTAGGKYYGTFDGTISGADIDNTNIGFPIAAAGRFTNVVITSNTESDNLTTGALQVVGGIAANANVNIGGNLTVTNKTTLTGNTQLSNVAVSGQVTGDVRLYGGTVYINDDPVLTANSTFSGGNITNPTRVTSRVASTRANTGAFVVDGGAGIVGNLYAGGSFVVTNLASAKHAAFTTNLVVGTSSNVVAYSNGAVKATLTPGSQPNITGLGSLTQLNLAGNVYAGTSNTYDIGEASTPFASVYAYDVVATQITGAIQTASQTNITAVGALGALAVTGNATVGNVAGTKGTFSNIEGNLLTAAQPNVTSVGTLTNLAVTGNVTAGANVTAANLVATSSIRTGTGANIIMAPNTYIGTSATAGVRVPVGATGDRPAAGTANVGMIRLNTTSGMFEGYTGTEWVEFSRQVSAVGGGTNKVFQENETTITEDYTITEGKSAMSVGPITMASGVTVTVPAGKRWVIL
jgi:hypothetical protein